MNLKSLGLGKTLKSYQSFLNFNYFLNALMTFPIVTVHHIKYPCLYAYCFSLNKYYPLLTSFTFESNIYCCCCCSVACHKVVSDSLRPHGIQQTRLASLSVTISRSLLKCMSIESYADDTTLMTESEEELKSFLMQVKEVSEKSGLKLNTQKTKIMASSPNFYITAININPTSLTLNI